MRAKVSLVIPVYNAEQYLNEALNSAVSQTLRDIEIICVDDGSTDSSADILKQYREKDSRISVITTENHGAGSARNTALSVAGGEWLAFMDADDMMTPNELEYAVAAAEKNDADVAAFEFEFIDKEHSAINNIDISKVEICDPRKREMLFPEMRGFVTTKLFRRKHIIDNNIRFQEISVRNDAFFCFAACTTTKRLAIINEPLYLYRTRGDSISHKPIPSLEADYTCVSGIQKFLKDNDLYSIYEKRFVNWAIGHLGFFVAGRVSPENYANTISELRDKKFTEFGFKGYPEDFYEPNNYLFLCALEQFHPENTGEIHRLFIENEVRLKNAYNAYNEISNSTCWKITKPLRTFMDCIKRMREK